MQRIAGAAAAAVALALLPAALGAGGATAGAVAAPGTGAVSGVVRDAGGEPVPAAAVTLVEEGCAGGGCGGPPVAEGTTDGEGRFAFDGLAAATYDLEVRSPLAGLADGGATVTVGAGETVTVAVVLPLATTRLVRVAGADRVATAVEASRRAFPSAGQVVLTSALTFPDALSAAPLALALDAPMLLTGPRLPPAVAAEIDRLGADTVVIAGAVGAVPLVVQEELELRGLAVRRVPGETRFDTAGLLARELGAANGEAVVVSAGTFPDALSVAPLAAAASLPIVLSGPASLDRDTRAAIAALDVDRTLVVGGEAAISGDVLASLPAPLRLAGAERYATSVAVAEELLRRGGTLDRVTIATGRVFADALVAGPVAGRVRGPVLLVDGQRLGGAPASVAFLRRHAAEIGELWVFGGDAAVTDEVATRLAQAASGG